MQKKRNLNAEMFCILFSLFLFTGINELSAQNRKQDNVTLSLKWLTQSQFAGYYAALDNGFYKAEGINLVIRPGMNGRELFNHMREINPEINALISSGYSLESDMQNLHDEGILGFLQKPYNSSLLIFTINKIME